MTLRIDAGGSGPGLSQADVEAYLRESLGGFTPDQLNDAFTAVQDKDHWKNPIDAVVDRSQIEVLTRSIPYHTGTFASFEDVEGQPFKVRVTADGYFAGPCN